LATYPYSADIEVPRLRLDLRNPRVAGQPDSQKEAFEEVADEQKAKLLGLARHIAKNGLSPAQRFIVIPDDENSFIVLDANRRLAALKALEHPELMQGFLTDAQMAQLRTIAADYDAPDDVPCVVFRKREDADVWVELLHEGQGDGYGLVEWTAQQKARHRARHGAGKAPHMQILEFVVRDGHVSPETISREKKGTYPVSTLERALTTPHVRQQLGIEIVDGQVLTSYPKPEVLKGLSKIVDEIGTGTVKVADFMSKEDRAAYVDRFRDEELPDPKTRSEATTPLDEAPERVAGARTRGKDRSHSAARTKMIPAEFSVSIPANRINDIYLELKRKLKLSDTPNAAAVLLRVFVELSVDDYIRRNTVPVPYRDKSLQNKITAVADYMRTNNVMTEKELLPVREAVKDPSNLTLTTNLNAFVHNPDMTPGPAELKAIWDRLARFIEVLWR
jgi:hypothetical protein